MQRLKRFTIPVLILVIVTFLFLQWQISPHYKGKTFTAWLGELKSDGPPQRIAAAEALTHFPADSARAVAALLQVAESDTDPLVRQKAVLALTHFGSQHGETMSAALTKVAQSDADGQVRLQAALALKEKGIPILTQLALRDPDVEVKKQATEKLAKWFRPVARTDKDFLALKRETAETLLAALKDGDANVRGRAPAVLLACLKEQLAPAKTDKAEQDEVTKAFVPKVVSGLIAALDDPDGDVRQKAVLTLAKVQQPLPGAEAGLLNFPGDTDSSLHQAAVVALARVPDLSDEGVAVLAKGLQTTEIDPAVSARLKKLGARAVPHLVAVLKSGKDPGRERAFACLLSIGKDARPALVAALPGGGDYVLDKVGFFLLHHEDIADLVKLRNSDDDNLKRMAKGKLDLLLVGYVTSLGSPDEKTRELAAEKLKTLVAGYREPTLTELKKAAEGKDETRKKAAAELLKEIK